MAVSAADCLAVAGHRKGWVTLGAGSDRWLRDG